MLYFNLRRVLLMRGVDKPMTFLQKHGFARSTAAKLANNNVTEVKTAHLEQLCRVLNCTPNDLYEWRPDAASSAIENHPLNELIRDNDALAISRLVKDIPIGKMERAKQLLEQLKDEV
jgi:DNA-binding Xre family transcriptional regulator